MPKYTADHYSIKVATSEGGLATAPDLSSWESIEFTPAQGRKKVPDGIGSRLQGVHVGLLDYSGSASGWVDESAVAGSSDIFVAFGMFQQSEVTPLYMKLTNKVSGKYIILKKVIGDVTPSIGSPEDFYVWSIDFDFEDIAYG